MELWIRSQNKEALIKCERLMIEEGSIDENYVIENLINEGEWFNLATYKTKERALEVLDEIQNALLNKWSNNVKYEEHYDDENPRSLVYEMPKE